jgi:menaquinol-cytochrome c reductase iron-sulfur subunit
MEPLEPPEDDRVAQPGRRRFLGWVMGIGGAVTATLLSIPLVRFALFPIFAGSSGARWSGLGTADQFSSLSNPVRKTISVMQAAGWQEGTSEKAIYVTQGNRTGSLGGVEVLTAVCPHLGCEVQWEAGEQTFYCPCHGSKFARDGKYIAGPAPRGMDTLPLRQRDGQLEVRYQYYRNLLSNKEVVS